MTGSSAETAPKRHVVHAAALSEAESRELGPLLARAAAVATQLTDPEQVYVCLWSHGESGESTFTSLFSP